MIGKVKMREVRPHCCMCQKEIPRGERVYSLSLEPIPKGQQRDEAACESCYKLIADNS